MTSNDLTADFLRRKGGVIMWLEDGDRRKLPDSELAEGALRAGGLPQLIEDVAALREQDRFDASAQQTASAIGIAASREADALARVKQARLASAESAAIELGRALEWALYWIARQGVAPTGDLEDRDEWQRWAEARKALKQHGPESPAGVDRTLRAHEVTEQLRELRDRVKRSEAALKRIASEESGAWGRIAYAALRANGDAA